MRKAAKFILITGAFLIALGMITVGAGYAMSGESSLRRYVDLAANDRNVTAYSFSAQSEVSNIELNLKSRSVIVVPGDGNRVYIESVESDDSKFEISQAGGRLKMKENLKTSFNVGLSSISFGSADFNGEDSAVYLHVPRDSVLVELTVLSSFGDVEIISIDVGGLSVELSYGDVNIRNVSSGETYIESSFGEIDIFGHDTGAFTVTGSNGEITISGVTSGKTEINSSFGDISLKGMSAASLTIKNSNGDVRLSSVTAETANVNGSFGNINAEDCEFDKAEMKSQNGDVSVSGGRISDASLSTDFGEVFVSGMEFDVCGAESRNGDVRIVGIHQPKAGTSLKLKTNAGKIKVDGESKGTEYEHSVAGGASINAKTSFGSIDISFK